MKNELRFASKLSRACLLTLLGLAIVLPVQAANSVGQVVSSGTQLDGISVPSGTTILIPAQVSTTSQPALLHLDGGFVFALDAHSVASLDPTAEGGLRIVVTSGLAAFQDGSGELLTLAESSVLRLNQGVGSGKPVQENSNGAQIVASLGDKASVGSTDVILSSSEDIDGSGGRVVFRTRDGVAQQLVCFSGVDKAKVVLASSGDKAKVPLMKLRSPLEIGLQDGDMVIQGESSFVSGQGEGEVATLRASVSAGTRKLPVEDAQRIDAWKRIRIRNSDGTEETHWLSAVVSSGDGNAPYVTLKGALDGSFSRGATLTQAAGEEDGKPCSAAGAVVPLTAATVAGLALGAKVGIGVAAGVVLGVGVDTVTSDDPASSAEEPGTSSITPN